MRLKVSESLILSILIAASPTRAQVAVAPAQANPPAPISTPAPKSSKKATVKATRKKKIKVASQTADQASKPPSKLPQFKRRKKVEVDFESTSQFPDSLTTVVVRPLLPVETAEQDQADAVRILLSGRSTEHTANRTTFVVAPVAVPVPHPMSGSTPHQTPSRNLAPPARLNPRIEIVDHQLIEPSFGASARTPPKLIDDRNLNVDPSLRASEKTLPIAVQPTILIGPPSPPPIVGPVAPVELNPHVAEKISATQTESPGVIPVGDIRASRQSQTVSRDESESTPPDSIVNRFYVRTSYLNAQYSQLESDLQNGATGFAFGASRTQGSLEARVTLEIGQGMDQAITLQNTRYLLLRADGTYLFIQGPVTPIAGIGLGYGNFNVFSYHSSDGSTITLTENAEVSSLITTPAFGVRANLPSSITLDLTAEYLLLIGAANAQALGGWTAALSLGVPF